MDKRVLSYNKKGQARSIVVATSDIAYIEMSGDKTEYRIHTKDDQFYRLSSNSIMDFVQGNLVIR
jgi:DNA-binding LytR/AlgR family response regulator